jgi:hypothetical protein
VESDGFFVVLQVERGTMGLYVLGKAEPLKVSQNLTTILEADTCQILLHSRLFLVC